MLASLCFLLCGAKGRGFVVLNLHSSFLERMERENEGGLFYIHFDCSRLISRASYFAPYIYVINYMYVKYICT